MWLRWYVSKEGRKEGYRIGIMCGVGRKDIGWDNVWGRKEGRKEGYRMG